MTYRLHFAGEIRKSETKTLGGKQMVEVQLCQKNYAPKDQEPSFTWLRIAVWEPKDFTLAKLGVGMFIAGSGEFSLRSFMNKDGVKQQSAEVRCSNFDIDGPRQGEATAQAAPIAKPAPRVPAAAADESGPPF